MSVLEYFHDGIAVLLRKYRRLGVRDSGVEMRRRIGVKKWKK